ncbi:MAG: shikimate dehydrogenase [Bacteroidetes bacterium GWF2_38_335]|nr:MAG: shikimate dehydrogenase [Bacteroidetes bacterium GWF2_38_335]OFY79017.1 MAG: shikimate dehydrogenase [Bacteroidetes bacterium RIFOXYA12_FULL_38_20]HBS86095.1 shikimate dehydrogenase [Bacteroidales bacterium]
MKKLGLIGYPLTHSFSARYFAEKFHNEFIEGWDYQLYPLLSVDELPALIKANPGICGLNVTIPYKEQVIQFIHKMDSTAKKTGAVNTIKINGNKLTGYNTDITGFKKSLTEHLRKHHDFAMVLGTGGAAKAVCFTLDELKIPFISVSRKPNEKSIIPYAQVDDGLIEKAKLIINTTPLGMFPNANSCPDLPYSAITKKHLLFDLVYNPQETVFMKKGTEKGAAVVNGMDMLKYQAEAAWKIWTTSCS